MKTSDLANSGIALGHVLMDTLRGIWASIGNFLHVNEKVVGMMTVGVVVLLALLITPEGKRGRRSGR